MIGYMLYNLKIIGNNNDDLLKLYEKAVSNVNRIKDFLSDKNVDNIMFTRTLVHGSQTFIVIKAMKDEPYLQLFRYEPLTKKLYDSISVADFVKTFSKDYVTSDIIDTILLARPERFMAESQLDAIRSYECHNIKTASEDFENCNIDDEEFEIDDFGDIGDD